MEGSDRWRDRGRDTEGRINEERHRVETDGET
jgi:hypothetical protein